MQLGADNQYFKGGMDYEKNCIADQSVAFIDAIEFVCMRTAFG